MRVAKRRRKPVRVAAQNNSQRVPLTTGDGYVNSLAYLGEASELNKASDYERHSITDKFDKLTVMYRENWIAKRIIDTPCEDMTRAWYSISSEIDQSKLDELSKLEAKHNVKQEITNGLRWARLYGGAAAVIVIKGQEDMLDQPLDYDMVVPGSFRGLIILDRTNGLYPSIELEDDMDDPEFGYPKYYQVQLDNMATRVVKIHHSRMITFRGRMLPIQEEINNDYWGASELEHVYEELQKRDSTSANIAQLVFQANVGVLKIADYGEVIGMATGRQKEQIYNTIFEQNRIRNSFGLMLTGTEDGFEQHPYSFSGLSEIYESFMLDMAGAAEIPATKLYGRAPQGMNATGESDMKNYYEMLAQLQERNLRPAIEKLLPVMAVSLWGEVPDDMEVVFEPLMTTTPAERAQITQQAAGSIIQAFSAGIISQRTALLELQETGKSIGAWTNITDEDIENADAEVDSGEDMEDPMAAMMGGQMPPEMSQEGPEEPKNGEPEELAAEEEKFVEEPVEAEDGGPGSGNFNHPGYPRGQHKASIGERIRFMQNPTEGLKEKEWHPKTREEANQEKREHKEWSDLTAHQRIAGAHEQRKHENAIRAEIRKAALKGDLDKARALVKANRHLYGQSPEDAKKYQSEILKYQKAAPKESGLRRALKKVFGHDKEWKEEQHPRGKGGKFTTGGSSAYETEIKSEPLTATEPKTEYGSRPEDKEDEKGHKTEKEILDYLSGTPKVNIEANKRHTYGTPEYDRYRKERKKRGEPPQSYFDPDDMPKVEKEVQDKIKNGDFAISEKRSGQKILEMHIASAKGTAYNDRNRKEKSSKIAVSVSTKTGYHWFPVTEDDDDDI